MTLPSRTSPDGATTAFAVALAFADDVAAGVDVGEPLGTPPGSLPPFPHPVATTETKIAARVRLMLAGG